MDKDKQNFSELSFSYDLSVQPYQIDEQSGYAFWQSCYHDALVRPADYAVITVASDSAPTKDEAMAAYEKLDHTLCLNSSGFVKKLEDGTIVNGNIKFNQDKDYHVDCNDLDEMIDCLETVRKFIEAVSVDQPRYVSCCGTGPATKEEEEQVKEKLKEFKKKLD